MSIKGHPPLNQCRLLALAACAGLLGACAGSNSLDLGGNVEPASSTTSQSVEQDPQSISLRQVKTLPAPLNTSGGSDQLISANDVLTIEVFDADPPSVEAQLDSRGRIRLRDVGIVKAAGSTARALEKKLERLYSACCYRNPDVSVTIKDSIASKVKVDGEVARPGSFTIGTGTTLSKVFADAGGFTEIADPSKVYVYRQIGRERLVAKYDVKAIRAARRSDPRIYGGDFVMVFSSDTKVAAKNLREALGLAAGATRAATIPGL